MLPVWPPSVPPHAVTVNYDAGLPESPGNSSKEGQMVTLVFHEFDLGWAGFVLQVMLLLGNCHCESGDVNPKSWINFQLHSPGVESTHMGLVLLLLYRKYFLGRTPGSLWCRTWHWEKWILYAVYVFPHISNSLGWKMLGLPDTINILWAGCHY